MVFILQSKKVKVKYMLCSFQIFSTFNVVKCWLNQQWSCSCCPVLQTVYTDCEWLVCLRFIRVSYFCFYIASTKMLFQYCRISPYTTSWSRYRKFSQCTLRHEAGDCFSGLDSFQVVKSTFNQVNIFFYFFFCIKILLHKIRLK